jgi:pimeloyl-ACP methyl ester carboxylesterase
VAKGIFVFLELTMASIRRPADRPDSIYLPILPGDAELHLRTAGHPHLPPLLLFHGAGADVTWHTWEPQMAAFGQLRRVYALDWPGWGESGGRRPERPDAFAPAPYVQVALSCMDALGIPRADIGGVSWGGRIALELALTAPERVGKLLLVDAAAAPYDIVVGRYAAVSEPVCLIWAEADPIIPVEVGRALADSLPNCDLHILPGSTHWPQHLHPDDFNQLAVDFLKRSTYG